MKIGFYIMGKKGYIGLTEFVNVFGDYSVAFVVGARDVAIEDDWYSEISRFCEKNGILFFNRENANDKSIVASDYNFAISWRWIIKDASRLVVFHDSLLPKYRGFAPLVNMLIDGVNEIGVTSLLASADYDKGDIIYQKKKRITYPIKISEAIDEIIPLYAHLVVKVSQDILAKGIVSGVPQSEDDASYSLWRDEKDYFIKWDDESERIKRFVDAVGSPYRGAQSLLNGLLVRIYEARLVQDVVIENRVGCIGKIIFIDNGCPVVVCGTGLLKLTDLRSDDGMDLVGTVKLRSRFENINDL